MRFKSLLLGLLLLTLAVLAFAADDGKQADRKAFIEKMINNGLIREIEMPGELPHIWITPEFLALDYKQKEAFTNVVFSYYHLMNEKIDMVVLKNVKTGEKIGWYSGEYGLTLDQ